MPEEYGYSSPTFSWNDYITYRPAYPPSLWSRILTYHTEKGSPLESYHDIGTGAGIAACALGPFFQNIHISDPSAHNLSSACSRLSMLDPPRVQGPWPNFTHSQTPAEDQSCVAASSLDLITVCEALHWTAPPSLALAQAHRSLKPGGTLALVYYCPRVAVIDNPRANAAWDRVMHACALRVWETQRGTKTGEWAWPQGDLGLDFAGLSEADGWEGGVRRVYINRKVSGRDHDVAFAKSERALREGWFARDEVAVRVGGADEVVDVEDVEDWGRDVDAAWFRGMLATMQDGGSEDDEALKKDLEAIEQAIEDEGRGGVTRVVWVVNIVLATKKAIVAL